LQQDVRAYAMLDELNIKPRTLYLTRVRNTHPRLKLAQQLAEAGHHGEGEGHASEHSAEAHVESESADH
jgi:hypothetical protein